MAQFICRDVSLGYDGEVIAEHISFEINAERLSLYRR